MSDVYHPDIIEMLGKWKVVEQKWDCLNQSEQSMTAKEVHRSFSVIKEDLLKGPFSPQLGGWLYIGVSREALTYTIEPPGHTVAYLSLRGKLKLHRMLSTSTITEAVADNDADYILTRVQNSFRCLAAENLCLAKRVNRYNSAEMRQSS